MSMNLAKQSFSTEPEYLIAGTTIGIVSATKTAGAAIKAHAPVALETTEAGVVQIVPVTADNAKDIYGIAPEAAAAGEKVPVYLTGEFFADALALETGVTVDTIEVAFRKIGIFLK